MTSRKDQEQYWARKDEPYKFVSSREFFEAFQSFHVGRELSNDLSVPFDKANKHPDALTTNKYGVKKRELLKACMSREILLMKRNIFVYLFKIIQVSHPASFIYLVFFVLCLYKISWCGCSTMLIYVLCIAIVQRKRIGFADAFETTIYIQLFVSLH